MNSNTSPGPGVYGAYGLVAFFGTLGSVIIAIIVHANMSRWTYFSDNSYATSAVMVALPAIMAAVIASYIHRTHVAGLAHRAPHDSPNLPEQPL